MTDIVKRLRSCQGRDYWPPAADRICAEAAAEIERLRAALQRIANGHTPVKPQYVAKDALEYKHD